MSDTSAVQYAGSLTTPECDETANYLLFSVPQSTNTQQLALFTKYHSNNYRNVQKLNLRTVWSLKEVGIQESGSSVSGESKSTSFAITPIPFLVALLPFFLLLF